MGKSPKVCIRIPCSYRIEIARRIHGVSPREIPGGTPAAAPVRIEAAIMGGITPPIPEGIPIEIPKRI